MDARKELITSLETSVAATTELIKELDVEARDAERTARNARERHRDTETYLAALRKALAALKGEDKS